MYTKTMIALAVVFGIATGAQAATKQHGNTPSAEALSVCGVYQGGDPAARIRFNKDCETLLINRLPFDMQ